jgi:Mn2+/Fe2+ NRAMP family transporter
VLADRSIRVNCHQAIAPVIPESESAATYWFFAIALFGAAMTPYEVFFFSSGAVEEHWTTKDLAISRLNGVRTTPGIQQCYAARTDRRV